MELGNAMGDRETVSGYTGLSQEKGFLYKCLGIIMRKSSKKDFVQRHLDTIFATVKHSSQEEREVCVCVCVCVCVYISHCPGWCICGDVTWACVTLHGVLCE